MLKIRQLWYSLDFWIDFCTLVLAASIGVQMLDEYKEDHIFADYVTGFSL